MTHDSKANRRQFFQITGGTTAVALAGLTIGSTPRHAAAAATPADEKARPFHLAMASYSLRKFSLEDTIKMTNQIGLDAICLKSFHLPLELTPAEVTKEAAKVEQAGIRLYGGGVITMKTKESVDQAFEYAKAAGMDKIVGVPAPELLPLVNDMVQKYDIAVCIHNHGPGDDIYPTPDVAYKRIKGLDHRIGLCHDVGHTKRLGLDPAEMSARCADRLLDVHIKDVTQAAKEGHSTPCGRGVIDLPSAAQDTQGD